MKTLQTQILETLAAVDRPGNYCASGTESLVLPELEVEGVGEISLPLTAKVAKELIACCHQAPYGTGTETVVDTNVRKVRELDPGQFKLLNPEWPNCVDRITDAVHRKRCCVRRQKNHGNCGVQHGRTIANRSTSCVRSLRS